MRAAIPALARLARRCLWADRASDGATSTSALRGAAAFLSTRSPPPVSLASPNPAALVYSAHGPPESALSLLPQAPHTSAPPPGTARIRWLLAPINWSDVNVIEGSYPGALPPPATPGNEGVGVVVAVGEPDSAASPSFQDAHLLAHDPPLAVGDFVVPLSPGAGTWRSLGEVPVERLWRVPIKKGEVEGGGAPFSSSGGGGGGLTLDQAATLCINPPTALHLLDDFVPLPPGASLIQTGGTTAVGRLVIQAARARGVKTISIVRDRPDAAALAAVKAALTALGADCVLSESEMGVRGGRAGRPALPLPPPGIPVPSLALDCVGGAPGTAAARALAPGGTLVVYGGLGRAPVSLPASALIFRDVRVRGFWLSGPQNSAPPGGGGAGGAAAAVGPAARAARAATLARAADLMERGILGTPVERVPLERWGRALGALREGGRAKQVLVLP